MDSNIARSFAPMCRRRTAGPHDDDTGFDAVVEIYARALTTTSLEIGPHDGFRVKSNALAVQQAKK
ncbi:hypothetical protein [Burkholderia sp. JP2-270]|uniref:hypothetical protein n=1 Tax=Burkholderia sp. JP2-270 TaxID=2217913 RepID=UPI0019550F95|nr:hypothetical protein [Burkholderia sp. JP2-270]